MLVWLGKQVLDQKDRQEVDNKSTEGSMGMANLFASINARRAETDASD